MTLEGALAEHSRKNREYIYLVLPDHITIFVLLTTTMKLINDLASNIRQHSFALEESIASTCVIAVAELTFTQLRTDICSDRPGFNQTSCNFKLHLQMKIFDKHMNTLNITTISPLCLLIATAESDTMFKIFLVCS